MAETTVGVSQKMRKRLAIMKQEHGFNGVNELIKDMAEEYEGEK